MKKLTILMTAIFMLANFMTWGQNSSNGNYNLVTNASTLQAGDTIVIGCFSKGKAAGAIGNNDYFSAVDATFSDTTLIAENAIEIILGSEDGAWTMTTYEGRIGTKKAKELTVTPNKDDVVYTWTINIADSIATIASTNTDYGWIMYNNTYPRFLNYTSNPTSSMILPRIYKRNGGDTPQPEPCIIADNLTINYDEISGTIPYSISNPVEGVSLSAYENVDWIDNMVVNNEVITFSTTQNTTGSDRLADITLSYQGADDKIITITQKKQNLDYAELPVFFDGGRDELPAGFTQTGLDDDYASSPKLKFNSTGDCLILRIDEAPGDFSFNIKGYSFSGGTFIVQTSETGTDYTNLKTYTELGGTVTEEFTLGVNVRYIKWLYLTKDNGNVAIGNIHVEPSVNGIATPIFSLPEGSYEEDIEVAITCATDNAEIYFKTSEQSEYQLYSSPIEITETTTIWAYASKDGENSYVVSATYTIVYVQPIVVTFSSNGIETDSTTFDFIEEEPVPENTPIGFSFAGWTEHENDIQLLDFPYYPESNVVLYAVFAKAENNGNYIKVTEQLTDWSGEYLIVYETDSLAFNGGLESLDVAYNTIPITISNKIIPSTIDTDAATFTISAIEDGYSIMSASGKYIGRTAKTNGISTSTTTAYINNISLNNEIVKVTYYYETDTIMYYLKYNSTSGQKRFRYYNSDSQKDIALYKKDEEGSGTLRYYTRVFDADTEQDNLTISGPSIILSGHTLAVTNQLINDEAENLVIEEGAQLIHYNTGVQAVVKKNIISGEEGTTANWYTIASPVNNFVVAGSSLIPNGNNSFELYYFDEENETWRNYKNEINNFTMLESGKGYLYSNNTGDAISFNGELFVGNISDVQLSYTESNSSKGCHLIGNPYSHNIYKGGAITGDYLSTGYYVINSRGAWSTKLDNIEPIAPCQGILVHVSEESYINFTNTISERQETTTADILRINVANNNYEDHAYIIRDEGLGLPKIEHYNPEIQMVYTSVGNENYAIACVGDLHEIDVCFKAKSIDTYTMSVKPENGSFNYLHLIDRLTGNDIDLNIDDSYSFIGSPNDIEKRFIVRFKYEDVPTHYNTDNFITLNNGDICIKGINGIGRIEIFDSLGRVFGEYIATADINISSKDLTSGIYVVRLIDDNGIKIQKILVNQ